MKTLYYDNKKIENGPSIFLAGPTYRDQLPSKSWRKHALKCLGEVGFKGVVYIPEYHTGKSISRPNGEDGIPEWEWERLEKSDIILFWIPRDLEKLPGFTTNVEFGRYVTLCPDKVFLGFPPNAPKNSYIAKLYNRLTGRQAAPDLKTLVAEVVKKLAMPNFFLVCGISGGGKSVLSERLLAYNKKKLNLKFFDPDMYYAKVNGDECIHKNSFEVWHTMFADIHKAEMEGKNILLTTNALSVSQRRQLIEWFPSFRHHLIWVISPQEKCFEGNKSRRRQVPEDILKKHWETMEFPDPTESGWDTITQLTNYWDEDNYIIFRLKGEIQNYLKFKR